MKKPKRDRLDPERRAQLLEIAAQEFAEHGYDGASLNRILERTGMGKSSFYYYFGDKADLLASVVEGLAAAVFGRVGVFDLESLSAENLWCECEDYYGRCLATASADAKFVQLALVFYQLRGSGMKPGPTDRMFLAARQYFAGFIGLGQHLGVIRTDLDDTLLLDCLMGVVGALDRWVVENWEFQSAEAKGTMAADHVGIIRRLLSP